MYLKLQTVEIPEKYLTNLFGDTQKRWHFSAIALDEEGKELSEKLSKFTEGETVEVIAEDRHGLFEGYCEIVKLEIEYPEDFNTAPWIYRFRGELAILR
jgi:hypothetical protein